MPAPLDTADGLRGAASSDLDLAPPSPFGPASLLHSTLDRPSRTRILIGTLRIAARQLSLDGPASAVTLAAAEVDLDQATRTTGSADLSLLQHGGDLLDHETAERAATWLLATLHRPTAFIKRTTPSYIVELRLLETLAAVVPALELQGQRAVIDRLMRLPGQQGQPFAEAWARIVRALADGAWTSDTALQAAEAAKEQPPALRSVIFKVAARYDSEIRRRIEQEAKDGSVNALSAISDLSELSPDAAAAIIQRLAGEVTQEIDEAHAGARSFGGYEPSHPLTLLNIWHPYAAQWDPLLRMLADDTVWPRTKRSALEAILGAVERIPAEILVRLRPIAASLASATRDAWADPFDAEKDRVVPRAASRWRPTR